jgi:methyl-accepting chemotaxis protein
MRKLFNPNIAAKLRLLTLSTGLGLAILASVFLLSERQLLVEERSNAIRQTVELAHGIASHYQGLAASGELTDAQARLYALRQLKALRYSSTEYFFVTDMHPRMVMHPANPKLDGTDLTGKADPNGLHLFVAMVDIVKAQGAGFVSYMWPVPGSETPVPKLTYVKGMPAWGWVIGSGVYVDSIDTVFWSRAAWFGGSTLLLGGALMLIGVLLSRSIVQPLTRAVALARTVAEGDLTTIIDVRGNDETAHLLQALRDMNGSLSGIVGQVDVGISAIATASSQIASGNQDLSARTEMQASSLEETASSMEQLTSAVQQNAANARHASALASSAAEVAVRGGAVVAQVVDTMGSIKASAHKIVDIIGVIDTIAFQTNILALNAAVEAARAGEQGRGFAVVAGEVRNLAQRSAAAAREVKGLIGDAVDKVGAGSTLVQQAGGTMQEIVDGVRQVNQIIAEIAAASAEQEAGIGQVNQAIADMDGVTQQNAALVEQAAAAATAMRMQADKLAEVFGIFKVARQPAPAALAWA